MVITESLNMRSNGKSSVKLFGNFLSQDIQIIIIHVLPIYQ